MRPNVEVEAPEKVASNDRLGLSLERSLVLPITDVRQYSEYGKFAVGDYVSRDGSDVQLVKDMNEDGA